MFYECFLKNEKKIDEMIFFLFLKCFLNEAIHQGVDTVTTGCLLARKHCKKSNLFKFEQLFKTLICQKKKKNLLFI
jgi:hypothetical protein